MDATNESHAAPSSRRPSRKGLYAAALLVILAAGALALFRRSDDPTKPVVLGEIVQPGAAKGFNVLLVTLDTTRPDRLGLYGYKKAQTPALDSLLEHGVRFDDAVTSAPTTLPAHATLLTGRYPPSIGVRSNGYHRLPEEAVSIAEIAKEHDYDTAAFIGSFVLDERFGTNQGFDTYLFSINRDLPHSSMGVSNERRADEVTTDALRWLNQRPEETRKPFFMWVHYFDPHSPHTSPLAETLGPEVAPYDAEIAFVDLQFQRLLQALDQRGIRESTLIVVASDHGESMGEHDLFGHGLFIYEPSMRVALVLSSPSLFEAGFRVDDRMVGLVDVAPTLQELLGWPVGTMTDGVSLLTQSHDAERTIYIETCYPRDYLGCGPLYGLRSRKDKFIMAPRSEYYILTDDPGELRNLFDPKSARVRQLQEELGKYMATWPRGEAVNTLSPTELERLKALGYVSFGAGGREDCDPKDHLELVKKMSMVNQLVDAGRPDDALPLAEELIEETSCWFGPVQVVARIHVNRKDWEKAATVLDAFLTRCPDAAGFCMIADVYREQRRYQDALRMLDHAELLDAGMGLSFQIRGDVAVDEGRLQDAVNAYEQALRIDAARVGPKVLPRLTAARKRLESPSATP